ncbi:hypothetical protein K2Q08_01920 [Patescibacteria group bacterium]|nr:hypothetical protein [Patescibacteria group bacterium]
MTFVRILLIVVLGTTTSLAVTGCGDCGAERRRGAPDYLITSAPQNIDCIRTRGR